MAPSDELEVDESSPARAVPCPWAMRADLPTGTVAFLFTDIEARRGSCTLSGPRRTHALAEHRRVLREAVAAGEGVEVDTQGDAFFCAFPTAAGLPRRRSLPRSGCAPGRSPTHRDADGNDRGLRGDRRAPRRASGGARSGGQIMLSPATAALLDGHTLLDLGLHRLEDFERSTRLYQLGEGS